MSSIYINNVAYDHIIDTNFGEAKSVSTPEWINQDPELDVNIWTKGALKIIYTLRITDAEKYVLDQLLTAHQKIFIVDDTYNIYADAWIRSINAKWEGNVNWANPWLIEIELVIVEMLEGDYSTWTKIWEWDFDDGVNAFPEMSITLSPDYVYILYHDDGTSSFNRFAILNIGDGSEKFLSPSGEYYQVSSPTVTYLRNFSYNTLIPLEGGAGSFSIRGKYVLIPRTGSDVFEIWKDGVKIWTSPSIGDVVEGDNAWQHALIRYDGKYIIVIAYPSLKVICFEGS